jgi:hypothetical protein
MFNSSPIGTINSPKLSEPIAMLADVPTAITATIHHP